MFCIDVDVVDEAGNSVAAGEQGILIIKQPWPSMARTIYKNDKRYKSEYFSAYEKQGWYKVGDSARKDEDGYIWIIAWHDDVIKVSGYRLGYC